MCFIELNAGERICHWIRWNPIPNGDRWILNTPFGKCFTCAHHRKWLIQYFMSPLLVAQGFVPVVLSNLLFMVSLSYYHYLNFLGYDVLPFLDKTTFFLYPIGFIIILSPFLVLAGFNPTRYALSFYFG